MKPVEVPIYDFSRHQRSTETRRVEPADVVIVEGILVLHMDDVREMLNMKIYVDTDDDVRLARRFGSLLSPKLRLWFLLFLGSSPGVNVGVCLSTVCGSLTPQECDCLAVEKDEVCFCIRVVLEEPTVYLDPLRASALVILGFVWDPFWGSFKERRR